MSRSFRRYDEDWQRRKSILIRSLFHDIPILSPVTEESNDSTLYIPAQDSTTATENFVPTASPPRPYSPLPPLIIEKIPTVNKHDEPEEYYQKLHKKLKRIYIKLFIENRNINSIDYDSICNDSIVNDDDTACQVNEEINFVEDEVSMVHSDSVSSSIRESSNGYGADCESICTDIVDVVNYTLNNGDEERIQEVMNNNKELDGEVMDQVEEVYVTREECFNDQEDLHETEDEQEANDVTNDNLDGSEQESDSKQDVNTSSGGDTLGIPFDEAIEENNDFSNGSPDYRQITTEALIHVDGTHEARIEIESRVYEDSVKSFILPTRYVRVGSDDGGGIQAVNGGQDEDLTSLEDNADPETAPPVRDADSNTTFENIEEMRTPYQDSSHETVAIHHSTFESSQEHITFRQNAVMTSPSQNGRTSTSQNGVVTPQDYGNNDLAENRNSNEINEILTSIFKENENNGGNEGLGRKRKMCDDKSVQVHDKVTWDDVRDNFFVGVPKIFRLCACVDHVCH